MKVYVFRDTAVVTYIKEYRQKPDTTEFSDEDDTDVFTRDASGWHLRFTKTSPVLAQAARIERPDYNSRSTKFELFHASLAETQSVQLNCIQSVATP